VVYFIEDFGLVIDLLNTKLATRTHHHFIAHRGVGLTSGGTESNYSLILLARPIP